MTVCYKLRDRRFLIKSIPSEVISLQIFMEAYEQANTIKEVAEIEARLKDEQSKRLDKNN